MGLMMMISNCRKGISNWKRSAKQNSILRIQELKFKIDAETHNTCYTPSILSQLRKELSEEYYNEEIFWKQKSRLNWLKAGNKNTRFFHAITKKRRAQNQILSLVDAEGKTSYEEKDLGRVAEDYFKFLFTSEDVGMGLQDDFDIPS